MSGEDLRPFIAILTALLLPAVTPQSVAHAQSPTSVDQIVAQKVQPMLPEDASGGGAVAVRIDGQTAFFNFGTADRAKNRPVTTDSVFNLASVGKSFRDDVAGRSRQAGGTRARRSSRQIHHQAAAGRRYPPGDARPAREPHLRPAACAGAVRALADCVAKVF